MRTEEYKGRTLTITDTQDGDPAVAGIRLAVRWMDKGHEHGLTADEDLPALILVCKQAIDLHEHLDKEVK